MVCYSLVRGTDLIFSNQMWRMSLDQQRCQVCCVLVQRRRGQQGLSQDLTCVERVRPALCSGLGPTLFILIFNVIYETTKQHINIDIIYKLNNRLYAFQFSTNLSPKTIQMTIVSTLITPFCFFSKVSTLLNLVFIHLLLKMFITTQGLFPQESCLAFFAFV